MALPLSAMSPGNSKSANVFSRELPALELAPFEPHEGGLFEMEDVDEGGDEVYHAPPIDEYPIGCHVKFCDATFCRSVMGCNWNNKLEIVTRHKAVVVRHRGDFSFVTVRLRWDGAGENAVLPHATGAKRSSQFESVSEVTIDPTLAASADLSSPIHALMRTSPKEAGRSSASPGAVIGSSSSLDPLMESSLKVNRCPGKPDDDATPLSTGKGPSPWATADDRAVEIGITIHRACLKSFYQLKKYEPVKPATSTLSIVAAVSEMPMSLSPMSPIPVTMMPGAAGMDTARPHGPSNGFTSATMFTDFPGMKGSKRAATEAALNCIRDAGNRLSSESKWFEASQAYSPIEDLTFAELPPKLTRQASSMMSGSASRVLRRRDSTTEPLNADRNEPADQVALRRLGATIYCSLSIAQLYLKDCSKAESAAKKAIELDPGLALGYVRLGQVYRKERAYVKAEQLGFSKAIHCEALAAATATASGNGAPTASLMEFKAARELNAADACWAALLGDSLKLRKKPSNLTVTQSRTPRLQLRLKSTNHFAFTTDVPHPSYPSSLTWLDPSSKVIFAAEGPVRRGSRVYCDNYLGAVPIHFSGVAKGAPSEVSRSVLFCARCFNVIGNGTSFAAICETLPDRLRGHFKHLWESFFARPGNSGEGRSHSQNDDAVVLPTDVIMCDRGCGERYCSEDCRKGAWESAHWIDCRKSGKWATGISTAARIINKNFGELKEFCPSDAPRSLGGSASDPTLDAATFPPYLHHPVLLAIKILAATAARQPVAFLEYAVRSAMMVHGTRKPTTTVQAPLAHSRPMLPSAPSSNGSKNNSMSWHGDGPLPHIRTFDSSIGSGAPSPVAMAGPPLTAAASSSHANPHSAVDVSTRGPLKAVFQALSSSFDTTEAAAFSYSLFVDLVKYASHFSLLTETRPFWPLLLQINRQKEYVGGCQPSFQQSTSTAGDVIKNAAPQINTSCHAADVDDNALGSFSKEISGAHNPPSQQELEEMHAVLSTFSKNHAVVLCCVSPSIQCCRASQNESEVNCEVFFAPGKCTTVFGVEPRRPSPQSSPGHQPLKPQAVRSPTPVVDPLPLWQPMVVDEVSNPKCGYFSLTGPGGILVKAMKPIKPGEELVFSAASFASAGVVTASYNAQ